MQMKEKLSLLSKQTETVNFTVQVYISFLLALKSTYLSASGLQGADLAHATDCQGLRASHRNMSASNMDVIQCWQVEQVMLVTSQIIRSNVKPSLHRLYQAAPCGTQKVSELFGARRSWLQIEQLCF